MYTQIHETPKDLGNAIATKIIKGLNAAKGRYLLGCPTGRSPKPVYDAFAQLIKTSDINLSNLVLVMMDEFLINDQTPYKCVDSNEHFSCRRFAEHEIAGHFNTALPQVRRLPLSNIWFADPNNPAAFDRKIEDADGIDLFLLASGESDGHIAFNPPGSPRNSVSYVADLALATRRDNLRTFPDFKSLDEVPKKGVTVGVDTIAKQSRSVEMIVWGKHKRTAFQRIREATCYDPDWPATIAAECRNATLHADKAASGQD